jgi:large subunit ribosomal protein L28
MNPFVYYINIKLAKYIYYDSMITTMAKVCDITKKGSIMGGGYSNRTRATQFNPTGMVRKYPNLQKKKVYVPELKKSFNLTISTRALKTIQKRGAFITLKKAGIIK